MNRIAGLALLVGGIVLIVFGINATKSFSSDVSRFFTGSPTDKAVWMLIGGVVAVYGEPMFWLVVMLIAYQYRQMQKSQRRMFTRSVSMVLVFHDSVHCWCTSTEIFWNRPFLFSETEMD